MIDFLSKPTLVGFTAGAAVIVSLQQLKGLLGIVHFTGKMQFIPVMFSVFNHRSEVSRSLLSSLFIYFFWLKKSLSNSVTLLTTISVVMGNYCDGAWLLDHSLNHKTHCKYLQKLQALYQKRLCCDRIFNIFLAILQSMRKPKLFWISAASPLASVVISTLLVFLIRNKTQAISFVRTFLSKLSCVMVKTDLSRLKEFNL